MSTLLQILLNQRKTLNLTQQKMAEKLGISRNYLALIETGKRPVPSCVAEQIVTMNQQSETVVDCVKESGLEYDSKDAKISKLESQLDRANETIIRLTRLLEESKHEP